MSLRPLNNTRYHSDKPLAQRTARVQLGFIIPRINLLPQNKRVTAESLFNSKEEFSPKQISLIDTIYESTMKALGFESFKTTYKPKKRGY